jgi:hypothetical protein
MFTVVPPSPSPCHTLQSALEEALKQLYVLDAIDSHGHITPLGRTMAGLPLEPSLARALLAAQELRWGRGVEVQRLGSGHLWCACGSSRCLVACW